MSIKQPDNRILRWYAAAGIAVGLAMASALGLVATGAFSSRPQVTAVLSTVPGALRPGADVKLRGVIVGSVTTITKEADGVRLKLRLDPTDLAGIPAHVHARVLPATVFGTSFLDLVPSPGPTGHIDAGAVIQQDTTAGTVELQQTLDDIDGVIKALSPADLNTALSAAASALDGRGREIAALTTIVSQLLTKANASLPVIQETLALLATNLDTIEQAAPGLLQALRNGLVTARTISDTQQELAQLLTGGLTTSESVQAFLTTHGALLTQALQQIARVTSAFYDNRTGIPLAVDGNAQVGQKVPTVIDHGRVVIGGILQRTPPPYYTSADCPRYGSLRGRC